MRYYYNFSELNWIQQYKSVDQLWLLDSLNWEKLNTISFYDYSLIFFIYNNSFINQHFIIDYVSKLSQLDLILLNINTWNFSVLGLYNSFVYDLHSFFFINSSFKILLFSSFYQDIHSLVLLFSPELVLAFNDYFIFLQNYSLNTGSASAYFDSYVSNINYNFGDGVLFFFMFFIFSWFIIYFFLTSLFLRWSINYFNHLIRFYLYFFSMSKETRLQFESVIQTAVFFIFYWAMAIMTFDDDKEELIEYLDTIFFLFFTFILFYFFFKNSVHYFSFLEASATGSKSTAFLMTQFKGDFLAFFSMILRFYSLLLRLNVYDILDDCLDAYYIFIGDFDDDEYLSEFFFSIHGTLFFSMDNHDDRSFIFEDENDFFSDLFYMYFLIWGKIFYFLFYTVELIARFLLAFYVIYLVLFEIYGVNCSYKEDRYFTSKKLV